MNIMRHHDTECDLDRRCFIQTFSSDDLPYAMEEALVLWVGRRLVMDEFYLWTDQMLSLKVFGHCSNIIMNK